MKTKSLLKQAILVSLSLSLSFCSKPDDPTPEPAAPLQDPLAGYLEASGFNKNTVNFINSFNAEFGYSFIPLVNGKMTAIVVKIPDAHLGMRVTIWDKNAGTVLRTETIDVTRANEEVTKQIVALDLVKDKEYFLTMNGNDWYSRENLGATYPFIVGDIKVTSYAFIVGTAQTMPIAPFSSAYGGDCSFKFQK